MKSRNHPAHRDKTHDEMVKAMKNRMGGYWRDENGAHHAYLLGLPVDAYDMYKAGSGFPDFIVFVSWCAVAIEIKNPEGKRPSEKTKKGQARLGFYTPAEDIFMQNFHGLRRTCTEQNEIYGELREVALMLLKLEDLTADALPPEYARVFFPKMNIAKNVDVESA